MTNRHYAADFACNAELSESFVGVGIGEDLRFKTRQGPNMSEIISSKLVCTNNSFCDKNRQLLFLYFKVISLCRI